MIKRGGRNNDDLKVVGFFWSADFAWAEAYTFVQGKGLGMSEQTHGGVVPPILSSDMEIEKGKGQARTYDSHLGKYAEGTSGTNKEGNVKGETRKAGKCVPK